MLAEEHEMVNKASTDASSRFLASSRHSDVAKEGWKSGVTTDTWDTHGLHAILKHGQLSPYDQGNSTSNLTEWNREG